MIHGHNRILFSNKKVKTMQFAIMWMNLEGNILNDILMCLRKEVDTE